jgi:hypothetical protein
MQVFLQERFIARVLSSTADVKPPIAAELLNAVPPLRSLAGVVLGLGFRPEHVRTKERAANARG